MKSASILHKETVLARIRRDPKFARALWRGLRPAEALQSSAEGRELVEEPAKLQRSRARADSADAGDFFR